ncbi:MAG: hypothetical protein JOZ16_00960 [Methylobacteriaceae bacterium]|nr:hypothetical protein [Methylobacteriaceae bacterium]
MSADKPTPISFARLQEYLDLIVEKEGGNVAGAPHKRFWGSYQSLTSQPIPRPKCQGADIFPIKYTDAAKTQIDADNSPLYLILTNSQGFCEKEQMPPAGPFITDTNYTVTLADGTVVTGDQIKNDIHVWLAAGAPNT